MDSCLTSKAKYILVNFKLSCKKQECKSSTKESRDFNINIEHRVKGKITTNQAMLKLNFCGNQL
jgi:hypothetical protein